MAAPLRVPRVPAFPKLLQQLGAEEAAASDISLSLARASDALLAGTAAFRTPTAASAAAVTAHGFELEVEPGKRSTIVIGVATAPLVLALSPLLVRRTRAHAAQTPPPRAQEDRRSLLTLLAATAPALRLWRRHRRTSCCAAPTARPCLLR